jgi:dienelactone hydrolase
MIKYIIIIGLFLFIPLAYAGKTIDNLKYANEIVTLDIYNPGQSNCPVAILIHGAAGITGDRAMRYEMFAWDLYKYGIIAINVHYFDSKKSNWKNTITEAITYAQKIANADKNRIGLIGYSLGGTLALEVASRDDRVKLLGISAGFLPAGFTKEDAAHLPKTFMVSGDKDQAITTLRTLDQWFAELDKPFQKRVDPGIGHDNVPINIFNEDWKAILKFFVENL